MIIHYQWTVERKSKGAQVFTLEVNACGKMDWRMMQDGEQCTNDYKRATCPKCLAKINARLQAGERIYYLSLSSQGK